MYTEETIVMIAFVMEDENPFGLKFTVSCLQKLKKNLEIISIGCDEVDTLYKHLSNYDEAFFLVFRAGDKIFMPQFEKLLFSLSQLDEMDAGVADEEEEKFIIPIAWRTKAVLMIPRSSWEHSPFKQYSFYHLYFCLCKQWTWERAKLEEYIVCQLQEPRWKKQKLEWELLYPILSASTVIKKNTTPTVSVVICSYNDARYLHCAIQSVLIQSNPNWELIVVNDGSTDSTKEVLALFRDDPRINVIENRENKGKSKSLNSALSLSKGEWLLELDADDWLVPDCIDQMLTHLEGRKEEVFAFADYYEWIERKNKKILYSQTRTLPTILTEEALLDNPLPIAPRMYNTLFLKEIGGWCTTDPYEGRLYEDLYLLSQCRLRSFIHVPLPLYHRRVRGGSITQREKGKFNQWKNWFIGM